MKNNYLPYFNSLDEKDKTFWLDCSKEELIDHFIANVKNGEVLLHRIDKAKEEINYMITNADITEISAIKLKQILGDKENEDIFEKDI